MFKRQKLLLQLLPLFSVGLLTTAAALAQAETAPAHPETSGVTILQDWIWSGSGQEERIELSPDGYRNIVRGAGLPEEGVVTEKPIAKIEPDPTAKEGLLITGPDPAMGQLFEAIHWYELGEGSVKLYLSGQQFETLDEALQSKGDPEAARLFSKSAAAE